MRVYSLKLGVSIRVVSFVLHVVKCNKTLASANPQKSVSTATSLGIIVEWTKETVTRTFTVF
jgi:hypothetical protein